jgi:hypothetical protein
VDVSLVLPASEAIVGRWRTYAAHMHGADSLITALLEASAARITLAVKTAKSAEHVLFQRSQPKAQQAEVDPQPRRSRCSLA